MPKRFTLPEAEGLLAEAGMLLGEAVSLKSGWAEAEAAFRAITGRVSAMGGIQLNREETLAVRSRRDRAVEELRTAIGRIQQSGCIVKDLDAGLLDFPTFYRGEEVYLCWKLGEPGIRFWHGVDEGFAGRKPIDQDFLEHHTADG